MLLYLKTKTSLYCSEDKSLFDIKTSKQTNQKIIKKPCIAEGSEINVAKQHKIEKLGMKDQVKNEETELPCH